MINYDEFMALSSNETKKREFEKLCQRANDNMEFSRVVKFVVLCAIIIVIALMAALPAYGVWRNEMKGKAELARAEHNRQILINEAKALEQAARYRAEAEVQRARGIDGANKIIASSLGGPEGYLRYLYIDALQTTNCNTIYVPTEAGLPILEANRLRVNNEN